MKSALCHPSRRPEHVPPQAWFATARRTEVDGVMMSGFKLAKSALAICRDCPVQWDCFEYAIAIDTEDGIWGAEEADMRRWKLKRSDVRHTMVERARHAGTPIQQAAKGAS